MPASPRWPNSTARTSTIPTNYVVIRTRRNELSAIYNAGRYLDWIVVTGEGLRFRERIAVFDSELIPNSLIYPI